MNITIKNYNDLVAAFRARKEQLGLSDSNLDDAAGLTPGHTNKVLGPSRERGIGSVVLEAYLMALAIDLVMVASAEKLAVMQPHYDQRKETRVRTNHAIGDRVLSRAMSKLAKQLAAKMTAEQRSDRARKAAFMRWSA